MDGVEVGIQGFGQLLFLSSAHLFPLNQLALW
jgi:hypothetical protein